MAVSKETYKIVVEFRRDNLAGWGHDPQDFVEMIKHDLGQRIPHYLVDVSLLPQEEKCPDCEGSSWKETFPGKWEPCENCYDPWGDFLKQVEESGSDNDD